MPIYSIIFLTITLVISFLLNDVIFYFDVYPIIIGTLTYPLVYFFVNRITEKKSLVLSLVASLMAVIVHIGILLVTQFLTIEIVVVDNAIAYLGSFLISVFITVILYSIFIKGKESIFLRLFILFISMYFINRIAFDLILDRQINFNFNNELYILTMIHIVISLIMTWIFCLLKKDKYQ